MPNPIPAAQRVWVVTGNYIALSLMNASYALFTGNVLAQVVAYGGLLASIYVSHVDFSESST